MSATPVRGVCRSGPCPRLHPVRGHGPLLQNREFFAVREQKRGRRGNPECLVIASRRSRRGNPGKPCHCEERSDVAIQMVETNAF